MGYDLAGKICRPFESRHIKVISIMFAKHATVLAADNFYIFRLLEGTAFQRSDQVQEFAKT